MPTTDTQEAPQRGTAFLRNKQTGEIREVLRHGEFDRLVSQREDDGVTTVWEQTSELDAAVHGPVDGRVLGDYGAVETVGDREGAPQELETVPAGPMGFEGPEGSIEHTDPDAGEPNDEFDVDSANKDQLEAEAQRRGLEVEGTGSGGNVTADDYRAALRG